MIFADIDLGHVGPCLGPRVRDVEANSKGSRVRSWVYLQPGILEARIREPEAEREERLDAVMLVAPIADEDVVLVRNCQRSRRRIVPLIGWVVLRGSSPN